MDRTVHLCLQLVGASADRSAVSSGPQGSRIILKILHSVKGSAAAADNAVAIGTSTARLREWPVALAQ